MNIWINPEKIARDVIVLGASAGGIHAVIEILSRLPEDLPAFIGVVIHRRADLTSNWSNMLAKKAKLRVVEPTGGDGLTRGVVYVAPADRHMRFERESIAHDGGAPEHHTRPAVDPGRVAAGRDGYNTPSPRTSPRPTFLHNGWRTACVTTQSWIRPMATGAPAPRGTH